MNSLEEHFNSQRCVHRKQCFDTTDFFSPITKTSFQSRVRSGYDNLPAEPSFEYLSP